MSRFLHSVFLTLIAGLTADSQVLVSNTFENFDPEEPLASTPVTFSRIGADGDFTKGICPSIDGRKLPAQVDVLRRAPDGSIWYYTKLNIDNSYNNPDGLKTEPDADGNWPLRENGWGHGFTYNTSKNEQKRWWGWHRYGAWVGLVSAVDGEVPKAAEAWERMKSLASPDALYGYEMIPRDE